MTELPAGSTIGILGGGQLGRMLSVAASRLGYRSHIYEPAAAPAGDVAHADLGNITVMQQLLIQSGLVHCYAFLPFVLLVVLA